MFKKLQGHPPVAGSGAGAEISPAPQTPPPELPPVISRAALNQTAALFPVVAVAHGLADADLLARVEQAAYEAHLRFPGMRRTLRAMRQERMDSIFGTASGASQVPGQTQLAAPLRGTHDPARPAPVLPNVTAAGRPSRAQLEALANQVFPSAVGRHESLTDQALFEALEKAAYLAHVRLPGARGCCL